MALQDFLLPPSTKFRGKVTKIYFEDPDTDFYIFQAQDLDSGKKRKVKGYFFSPRIHVGAEFEVLRAEWEKSAKYGSTYVVEQARALRDTKDARISWVKNSCPSIGVIVAGKIVEAFETLGVEIEDGMQDLDLLKGLDFLGDAKAWHIHQEWQAHNSYANAAHYLTGLGLPTAKVKAVYEALGCDTEEIVMDNPYSLALAEGVSFPVADRIAMNAGFTQDSDMRISSILEYMLEVASERQGHLYLEKSKLLKAMERLPSREKVPDFGRKLAQVDIDSALANRVKKGRIVIEGDDVYIKKNYDVEHDSAVLLKELSGEIDLGVDTDTFLSEYERIYGITFSEQQADAVRALNENKVLLLTGLPGTGKSTVTKALVRLFDQAGISYTLMAPTGIAAKRLSTVVGAPAATIHRTLGFTGTEWKHNKDHKFVTDAVIVDESSMIDQYLLYKLLSALTPKTIVVFVGDHAQLPSVGAGNVLHEMIDCEVIKRIHLTEIFRQEGASDIVLNAHRINSGSELILADPTDKTTDFRFIQTDSMEGIAQGVLHVVKGLFQGSSEATFQVISPTYKGPLGVDRFNEDIKELLNPKTSQQEVTLRRTSFREDDRLMIVKNNYNLNVYNGEIGKLHQIVKKDKILRVKIFDEPHDRFLELPFAQAPNITTLAYAMTVHRVQGNEFDYVILPFHSSFSIQLQRNLLYTAVTRAKKKVFIFGEYKALVRAIENDSVTRRNTNFSKRLRELLS